MIKKDIVLKYDRLEGKYILNYTCPGCQTDFRVGYMNKKIKHSGYCFKCVQSVVDYTTIHGRKISLKNCINGQIEEANSITEFCENHPELGIHAKHHLTEVLNKRRNHYKGWMRSDSTLKIDPSKIEILYQVNIQKAIIKDEN